MWVALSFSTHTFTSGTNLVNLLRQASLWSIIAVGQTFVIITAGIDLSVGAVIGFAGVIMAMLMQAGVPILLAVLVTLLVGVAIGLFHGFGIMRMGLPPFIMTLATLTALRGLGYIITNGAPISGFPDAFTDFSVNVPRHPHFVLDGDPGGRRRPMYCSTTAGSGAISSPSAAIPEAARLSGVNIPRMIYSAYVLSATFAAFAGILTASRIGVAIAGTGEGWELQSIASSVIGGTSLFGAVGSVPGPLLGAMLISTINNGANLLNVNSFSNT